MRVPTSTVGNVRPVDKTQGFVQASSNADAAAASQVASAAAGLGQALGSIGEFLGQQDKDRRRVAALKSFSDFQMSSNKLMFDAQRAFNPAVDNFSEQWSNTINSYRAEWLDTVDKDLRQEFDLRSQEFSNATQTKAQEIQYLATDNFFRESVATAISDAQISLDQDGSAANLDTQVGRLQELIQSTTLTEAEKQKAMRDAVIKMSSVSYKSSVREGALTASAIGVGAGDMGTAIDLIKEFDGNRLDNGLSFEQNDQLIGQRLKYAEQAIVDKLGSVDRWAALPDRARAALLSLVDDTESVPQTVVDALNSGDLGEVAHAVEVLGGDRRKTEADIIRGVEGMPNTTLDTDPRYANIPYEDRLLLRADGNRQANAILASEAQANKAAEDSARNDLFVGLQQGNLGEMDIQLAMENGLLTQIGDIQKAYGIVKADVTNSTLIANGLNYLSTGATMDPGNPEHTKQLNALIGEAGLTALENKDAGYVAQALVPLVSAAQIIPLTVRRKFEGMIRSSDPTKVTFAMDTLIQLNQAAPDSFAQLPEQLRSDFNFWTSTSEYYTQEERVQFLKGGLTADARQNTIALEDQARAILRAPDNSFDIMSELAGSPAWPWQTKPSATPGATAAMDREYNALFTREFSRDGDPVGAKQRALQIMTGIWGMTSIGVGGTMVKYPPELVGYPKFDGGYDWITAIVRKDLAIPSDQNFRLISDDRTASEYRAFTYGLKDQNGDPIIPSYLVYRTDEYGVESVDLSQRIKFDTPPELEAAKIELFKRSNVDSFAFNEATRLKLMRSMLEDVLRSGRTVPEPVAQELLAAQQSSVGGNQ